MLKQGLQQKLGLKINPLQIQLIKLLELPMYQLEQRIKEELEQNPLLEEGSTEDMAHLEDNSDSIKESINDDNNSHDDAHDNHDEKDDFSDEFDTGEAETTPDDEFSMDDYLTDDDEIPDYCTSSSNASADDATYDFVLQQGASFRDSLVAQLGVHTMSDIDHKLAEYIIGNIDDDGYLRRNVENIVDDLAFGIGLETEDEKIESLLKIIQTFEPLGVGARNLQECLFIQIDHKYRHNTTNKILHYAYLIVRDSFEDFSKKHYDKIGRRLHINDEILKESVGEILKLNPKPGGSADNSIGNTAERILPDFTLDLIDGELQLSLNTGDIPSLRISQTYADMINENSVTSSEKAKKELNTFVKYKLSSARSFIDAIQQRNNTLMLTMTAIVKFQKHFFLTGDDTMLRPMILKNIADITGLDVSTISRVSNSKHVQTWFGIYALKTFFTGAMQTTSGEDVSTGELKATLKSIVDGEDKKRPLTDDELVDLMKAQGYQIARRTISKYRQMLDIPVARLRKEI